jgi:hypothetical protein
MNKLLLTFFAGAALCLAADPFVGAWKPNAAKMKMSPGGTPGREGISLTFEVQGKNQYHYTRTAPDGKASGAIVWIVDGKEHKMEGSDLAYTAKRIDDRHIRSEVNSPKGSHVEDWVVSADGKTLTETRKGTGGNTGRVLDEVYVYDKQPAGAK